MTIWWKIGLFCLFVSTVFGAGVYTEKKFNLAAQATSAYKALTNAQNGEMEIIKDQQKLEENHAKNSDPCDDVVLPSDDSRVLH